MSLSPQPRVPQPDAEVPGDLVFRSRASVSFRLKGVTDASRYEAASACARCRMPFPRRWTGPVTALIVLMATPVAAVHGQIDTFRVVDPVLRYLPLFVECFGCRGISGEPIGDFAFTSSLQAEVKTDARCMSTPRRVVEWIEVHSPAPPSCGVTATSACHITVVDAAQYSPMRARIIEAS